MTNEVNVDDLFAVSEEENQTTENSEQEDIVDQKHLATEEEEHLDDLLGAEGDDDAEEDESDEEEVSEEDEQSETDEEKEEVNPLEAELELERKRREDTQKWANDTNTKLKRALEVLKDKELLSEEEMAQLSADLPAEASESTFQEIGKQITEDIARVGKLLERQGKNPQEYVEAFGTMATLDHGLQKQLLEIPADERTAFVLEKGEELLDTYNFVKGKNSMLEVIQSAVGDREKLREEIRKEVVAEMGKQAPKQEVKSRPKIKGSNTDVAEGAEDVGIENAADLFKFQQ